MPTGHGEPAVLGKRAGTLELVVLLEVSCHTHRKLREDIIVNMMLTKMLLDRM